MLKLKLGYIVVKKLKLRGLNEGDKLVVSYIKQQEKVINKLQNRD